MRATLGARREPLAEGIGHAGTRLLAVKIVHTIVWAFFAGGIVWLPVLAWRRQFRGAGVVIGLVLVEVAVLAANGVKCPLTDVAARYTEDRRANFDIFLPVWLARYNKLIFGTLFVAGLAFTVLRWRGW
jgi:hypothetical protein